MTNEVPPCTRCHARGLRCTLDKNLQSLIDQDARYAIWKFLEHEEQTSNHTPSWKKSLEGQVIQLQNAVNVLLRHVEMPSLSSYNMHSSPDDLNHGDSQQSPTVAVDNDGDLSMEPTSRSIQPAALDSDIFTPPMNSLYEVTKLRALRNLGENPLQRDSLNVMETDFISRGVISYQKGQELFQYFCSRLDHFLYGIMCPHQTLNDARQSSTLLTVSVCAVAALHDPACSEIFESCHREYLNLVASTMFSRARCLDDLRALVIGAFWLSNISWTLSGHAIRIATSLNYHQAFSKAIEGSTEHYEKAQIWYILYIVDHHSSILYGRPPILHEQEALRQWDSFTKCGLATEADVRISSQVSLYLITSRLYEMFGGETTRPIPAPIINQLRVFNVELDNWCMYWSNRLRKPSNFCQYLERCLTCSQKSIKSLETFRMAGCCSTTILQKSTFAPMHSEV